MKNIKVGCAVVNQIPLDWDGNKTRIISCLQLAEKKSIQLLCMPELAISGYGCEDAFYSPFVIENSLKSLFEILPMTKNMVVAVGLPFFFKGSLFNVVAFIVNGKIEGLVPKKFLAGDGVHYEQRWFKAWKENIVDEVDVIDPLTEECLKIPIGDLYFDVQGVKIGLEICEEAWVAQRVGIGLAKKSVDIVLNPSASHFSFGKQEIRKRFVVEGSRAFNVAYLFTNLLGNEAGRIIFDGGSLIATGGNLIHQGERFSFLERDVISSVVDLDENRVKKVQNASFSPDLSEPKGEKVDVSFSWNYLPPVGDEDKLNSEEFDSLKSWEQSKHHKEEEFFRAMCLSLFDYLRKSRSHGFVISLSGGVDSSVVSLLAAYSLKQAIHQLGPSEFKKQLSYLKSADRLFNSQDWIKSLVTCAYQSTQNSSQDTYLAAKGLAEELGVTFYNWDLDMVHKKYLETIEKALALKLTWEQFDLSLQNIQARIRSPGIWLLANVKNALLLSTSNRSEAAVGYATMDGDTSGGLSPIAGVDKAFLNHWIRWMAHVGPINIGPLKSLSAVFKNPPTAELRPLDRAQQDEKDLMPYEILDDIEREFIIKRKSPREIFLSLLPVYQKKYSKKELVQFVVKFLRLWSRNQWKRERYAPAFHLDDESLDPKTWCRYPILSAGFEKEIQSLETEFGI